MIFNKKIIRVLLIIFLVALFAIAIFFGFFFEKNISYKIHPNLIHAFEATANIDSVSVNKKETLISKRALKKTSNLKVPDNSASDKVAAKTNSLEIGEKDDAVYDNFSDDVDSIDAIQDLFPIGAVLFKKEFPPYSPYVEFAATRFFSGPNNSSATGVDLFLPFWIYTEHHLTFMHLRLYDRSGPALEGNAHVGYRYLSPERDYLYGIYVAYDRKRSANENVFDQLTFGFEAWFEKLFLGANIYYPLDDEPIQTTNSTSKYVFDWTQATIWLDQSTGYEKPVGGVDATFGYEILNGLTAYAGGYYFGSSDINTIYGPKAKLTYDFSLSNGKRVLGVFDKIGLDVGVQRDDPRGTIWYLSANLD